MLLYNTATRTRLHILQCSLLFEVSALSCMAPNSKTSRHAIHDPIRMHLNGCHYHMNLSKGPAYRSFFNPFRPDHMTAELQLYLSFDSWLSSTLSNFAQSWWESNSHTTLVLVWLGYKTWENSHINSRLKAFINPDAKLLLKAWCFYNIVLILHFSFVRLTCCACSYIRWQSH